MENKMEIPYIDFRNLEYSIKETDIDLEYW